MKKLLIIIMILLVILFNIKDTKKEEEIRGVFISYIELNEYVNKDKEISKKNIRKIISNIKSLNLNTIILQVRPASDAIYDSKIFPYSMYVSSKEGEKTYDVLEYFIEESHKNDLKLYAWINPYRVRTSTNIESISKSNPAYKYIGTDTLYINNGIYYNPSKEEVTDLIVNGVKEILNYNIDGLLMDDYFYPDDDIDNKDYEEYKKDHNISKEEYHLQVINNMVEKVYSECKKKNIKFGISPDGNIDNNYQKNMADVRLWTSSNKYIDFIMPQVYYGFYNTTRGYTKVIKEWEEMIKNKDIDLLIALAFYKVGKEDIYARTGREEWLKNNNIIMREVILSRNLNNYKGFSLFKYDNIFNEDNYTTMTIKEIENLKKVVK